MEFLFTHMDYGLQPAVLPELCLQEFGANRADHNGETESQLKGPREVTYML